MEGMQSVGIDVAMARDEDSMWQDNDAMALHIQNCLLDTVVASIVADARVPAAPLARPTADRVAAPPSPLPTPRNLARDFGLSPGRVTAPAATEAPAMPPAALAQAKRVVSPEALSWSPAPFRRAPTLAASPLLPSIPDAKERLKRAAHFYSSVLAPIAAFEADVEEHMSRMDPKKVVSAQKTAVGRGALDVQMLVFCVTTRLRSEVTRRRDAVTEQLGLLGRTAPGKEVLSVAAALGNATLALVDVPLFEERGNDGLWAEVRSMLELRHLLPENTLVSELPTDGTDMGTLETCVTEGRAKMMAVTVNGWTKCAAAIAKWQPAPIRVLPQRGRKAACTADADGDAAMSMSSDGSSHTADDDDDATADDDDDDDSSERDDASDGDVSGEDMDVDSTDASEDAAFTTRPKRGPALKRWKQKKAAERRAKNKADSEAKKARAKKARAKTAKRTSNRGGKRGTGGAPKRAQRKPHEPKRRAPQVQKATGAATRRGDAADDDTVVQDIAEARGVTAEEVLKEQATEMKNIMTRKQLEALKAHELAEEKKKKKERLREQEACIAAYKKRLEVMSKRKRSDSSGAGSEDDGAGVGAGSGAAASSSARRLRSRRGASPQPLDDNDEAMTAAPIEIPDDEDSDDGDVEMLGSNDTGTTTPRGLERYAENCAILATAQTVCAIPELAKPAEHVPGLGQLLRHIRREVTFTGWEILGASYVFLDWLRPPRDKQVDVGELIDRLHGRLDLDLFGAGLPHDVHVTYPAVEGSHAKECTGHQSKKPTLFNGGWASVSIGTDFVDQLSGEPPHVDRAGRARGTWGWAEPLSPQALTNPVRLPCYYEESVFSPEIKPYDATNILFPLNDFLNAKSIDRGDVVKCTSCGVRCRAVGFPVPSAPPPFLIVHITKTAPWVCVGFPPELAYNIPEGPSASSGSGSGDEGPRGAGAGSPSGAPATRATPPAFPFKGHDYVLTALCARRGAVSKAATATVAGTKKDFPDSTNSGHWWAYVPKVSGSIIEEWYCANDAQVSRFHDAQAVCNSKKVQTLGAVAIYRLVP